MAPVSSCWFRRPAVVTRVVMLCMAAALFGGLAAWGQSARPGMGAIPYNGGVTFRVWAPNATSVGVKFKEDTTATPMVHEGASGNWSVDIPGAEVGQAYKYRINGSDDRRDPRARKVESSSGYSIVYDPHSFEWGDTPVPMPWRNDLVIYQMHIGTFPGLTNLPGTFDDAIDYLDHVRDLGISAVKVMPVNEFAGGMSWGYNPADVFAIESSYGGPDAFKRFVQACHERGMAVFIDVVHNHYGPSDLDMWQFDGWSEWDLGGIYFYNDGRAHTMWGSTRPDFGRSEVRAFIRDQIMMFVEEYRAGGFRWDSIHSTIYTDWGHNQQAEHMVRDINWELLQNHPHVARIAEDHAFDFSMNFESQWDVQYRWGLRGQVVPGSDADRNMWVVADLLRAWAGLHRVVFIEAHDYIARNHGRTRIPSDIFWDQPESIWSRKRSLLGAGIVLTTPGIPMLHQGQEMLETQAFHDDTPLRWERAVTHAGIVQAYTDMITARRNLGGATQGLKGSGVNVHHIDNDNKVVAFVRWDQGNHADDVVVVANFGATVWDAGNYSIGFPSEGTWYCHFNSDDLAYGADFGGVGGVSVTAAGSPPGANVNMGMYSLQIFSKTPPDLGAGQVVVDPPAPDGCIPVVIHYDPADGPLAGASTVSVLLGRNGWQNGASHPMALAEGVWTVGVDIPPGTYQLNMVFHDANPDEQVRIWDNNFRRDWHVDVANCGDVPPPPPGLTITQPPFNTTVSHSVSDYEIQGTATSLTGDLSWFNALTGASGTVPATDSWTIPAISLGVGANVVTVSSGGAILATDHAGNYSGGWTTGSNQGTGFGSWTLNGVEGGAGHFTGEHGWGFWSHEGGNLAEAIRPLQAPLAVGQTLQVRMKNGWIWEAGGSVGLALENASGDKAWQLFFNGGDATYTQGTGDWATDIGWTDVGLSVSFTVTGAGAYLVTVQPDGGSVREYTGTFAVPIERFRAWSYNNGTNDDDNPLRNFFVNNLSIMGGSEDGPSATVSILRPSPSAGPVIQGITPVPPGDGGGLLMNLDHSLNGITYAVWVSPSLFPDPHWQIVSGSHRQGTGEPLVLPVTNRPPMPVQFFRVGVIE